MAATFFLDDRREALEAFKAKLPENVYLPLNMGRYISRNESPKGRFFNERPNDSINLREWIQNQFDENNIYVQDNDVFTTTALTINSIVYPIGTSLTTIVTQLVTVGGGASDKHFAWTQATPSTTWNITHNLNKFPSVTIVNSSNAEVDAEVSHTSANSVVITFSTAFAGKAYFN